jgi:Bacterial mobilisation protein (MobC)
MKIENNTSNKGGRPKAKFALEKIIPARFTQLEYDDICLKAKNLKVSNSYYLRAMALRGSIKNLFSEEEQIAKKQLIGIANNLNQLLKHSNTYGLETMIVQVRFQLDVIDKILEKYNYGSGC